MLVKPGHAALDRIAASVENLDRRILSHLLHDRDDLQCELARRSDTESLELTNSHPISPSMARLRRGQLDVPEVASNPCRREKA